MSFLLGSRVLSKNILELLNNDLEFLGLNYIKRRYRTMSFIKTMNNEYTIRFDRSNSISHYGDYYYICSMEFVDMIGISKLKLEFSEIIAYTLIDNLVSYCNFGMDNIISLSISDIYMNTYTMMVEIIDPELCIYKITLDRYNPMSQSIDHVLHFTVDDDTYNDFIQSMYFSYLIDIDQSDNYQLYGHIIDTIPDE